MSTAEQPQLAAIEFEGVAPILAVKDIKTSIDYYVGKLGFQLDWQADVGFASVSRGRCHIMLCEGDQGRSGTWVWIGVGDAGQLFEQYKGAGAKIRHPPTNYEWAYEMQVEDPDGNVLRMGSETKPEEPIGPWLDMHGVVWEKTPAGWSQQPQSK
jgi:predicted enzyme related to lactoylglutathione lyase